MFQESWIPKIKAGGYTNFQLFDLENDPGQTNNLADEQPERLRRLKQQLLEINASVMAEGEDWHLRE
ncbi:arylsulfatase, partial [bacterium]|nr:arylsulfatase [bacterium]